MPPCADVLYRMCRCAINTKTALMVASKVKAFGLALHKPLDEGARGEVVSVV